MRLTRSRSTCSRPRTRRPFVAALVLVGVLFAPSAGRAKGCGDTSCHKKIHKGETVHGPLTAGACGGCHQPRGKVPDKHGAANFTLLTGDKPCLDCHKDVGKELQTGTPHAPVKKQGCGKCHLPHSSSSKFLLKAKTEAELCFVCHKQEKVTKFKFMHGPVAGGTCTFCHSPHASPNPQLLTSTGPKLCFGCHEADRFKTKFTHKALDKGCISCHAPHGAERKYFIRAEVNDLCGKCHEKIVKLAAGSRFKHLAITKTGCGGCHDPHGSKYAHLVKDHPMKVCTSCHDKLLHGKNQHGPVAEGDCGACHKPHGGENHLMLKQVFPKEFYGPFSKERFALCFECHEAKITKDQYTTTLTQFRDGKTNLHYLHVVSPGNNRNKGRSCKACHEVHAGPQERHIREKVPYGSGGWLLPVAFTKNADGGRCVVGCHAPKSYKREGQ